jgi:two-component system CheB/CheR fusion protein
MNPPSKRSPNVPQEPGIAPSNLDFPVVGIGASAGGFQAVKTFFSNMPRDSGMVYVVVFHLDPTHESIAHEIIQAVTAMPVVQVNSPVPIEKNHVYVISPAMELSMNDGYLRVTKATRTAGPRIAIDVLFRTLAHAHKERAFCIVLSGTGSDGSVGISRIKEQGGVALAQSPEDAEYEAMPRAAIDTGMVDLVLPVAEMPQRVLELWHNAQHIVLPTAGDPEITTVQPASEHEHARAQESLQSVLSQLRNATGHDFRHYKKATILRRLERRMQVTAQPNLAAYDSYLAANPEENKALLGDMLIGVTNFFRDREAFETLEREVVPLIVAAQSRQGARAELRAWSAGCSTGEEAYSLAMIFIDQLRVDSLNARLQIFATDIDELAIAKARAGVFPLAIMTDIPPSRLRQHMVKESTAYRVRKEVRDRMLFARHNILSDPPFSDLDLVVCRNLLIYLDREVQKEILRTFHFALRPGGYLFLGSSESADLCDEFFLPVDKKNRIYRAREIPGRKPNRTTSATSASIFAPAPKLQQPSQHPLLSVADIHNAAIIAQAPPSILIDEEAEILHLSEQAGQYLRYTGGELSSNLLTLIHPDLRPELRSSLFQFRDRKGPVRSGPVEVGSDSPATSICLVVSSFVQGDFSYILVTFETHVGVAGNLWKEMLEPADQHLLVALEHELQATKQRLQDTIETSETSTEELKASNEEMQAVNEELRSATEELETSKEELQSVNEELLTVNQELKSKVDETDQVNDYLSNLITSTSIATVFVDRSMHIKWFTPKATDIFSLRQADMGRPLYDITHRLQYDTLAEDAASVFESLAVVEREVFSDDGKCYLLRLLPYRSSEDHIDGSVLTFIDITHRRQAQDELRASEERVRLIAETTHEHAIFIMDENGVVTHWYKGAELIFGYSANEAKGRYFDFIFTEEDRAAGAPNLELQMAMAHGRGEDERWHLRKDGSRFYCSGEVTRLEGQTLRGYVKIAKDMTSQVIMQEQKTSELAETQNSSHLKDQFFAMMSHELRNPLNLIQLNADLIQRFPETRRHAGATKAAKAILDAVQSQGVIINDLLDIARVKTGKLKLSLECLDLACLLTEIHSILAEDGRRDIRLQLPAPEDEPVVINGDRTRMEQVIWNLVTNAMKFTPADEPIQLSLVREGDAAIVQVIDKGRGIASGQLERVFELYGQANNHVAAQQRQGLGIGLSLVKDLVEAQGGTVGVQSAGLGKGCTFTVRVPLMQKADASLPPSTDQETAGRLRGVKLLLVDDSADVLEALSMLLEIEEADVQSFSDPVKAIEAAQHSAFDIIVSDISMPGMDGYTLLAALRELPHLERTPSVALSGYGAESESQQSTSFLGFALFLQKPVPMEKFVEALKSLV